MTAVSKMPGHLIRRLHQISTRVFTARVKEAGFDLTPVQFAALDVIRRHPGLDQARLADAVAKDHATIGAVVDRLERKGLVARDVKVRDRRARQLVLTDKGEALIAGLYPVVEKLQAEILPGLTRAEHDRFVELAAKAARVATATSLAKSSAQSGNLTK